MSLPPSRWPIVVTGGTPFCRGEQHGRQAYAQVNQTLAYYRGFFEQYSDWDWDEVQRRAKPYAERIRAFDPEMLDEIAGVARGAGRNVMELVAVNARSELGLHPVPDRDAGVDTAAFCTSFAVMPEASASGHVFVGQNSDWKPELESSLIILVIRQSPPKPDITMVTEAGMIGRYGVNSAGLGVVLNGLYTGRARVGTPITAVLRGMLDSRDLPTAVRRVVDSRRSGAMNYLLAHADGEAVDLEAAPDFVRYLRPVNGILTHSNHFVQQTQAIHDAGRVMWPDTVARGARIQELLERQAGDIGVEGLKGALRDHAGYPRSICRHLGSDEGKGRMHTMASMIFDLSAGAMHVAQGRPCEQDYYALGFGEMAIR